MKDIFELVFQTLITTLYKCVSTTWLPKFDRRIVLLVKLYEVNGPDHILGLKRVPWPLVPRNIDDISFANQDLVRCWFKLCVIELPMIRIVIGNC